MAYDHAHEGDPGWGDAVRRVGWGFLPIPGMSFLRRRFMVREGEVTGLTMVRTVFATFAWSLVMIGLVSLILAGSLDTVLEPGPTAVGVAVVGVLSLLGTHRLPVRLDGTSEPALATSYRTRFFLRIAVAEAAALVGFLGFILTARPWVYAIGAAFAGLGFVTAAPGARNLDRDQQDLMASGSTLSLRGLLTSMRSLSDGAG
jgi:hypothetical protein